MDLDLGAVFGVGADRSRQLKQLESRLKIDLGRIHGLEDRCAFGFAVGIVVDLAELHVGTEAAIFDQHDLATDWIVAEFAITAWGFDELDRFSDREFVERNIVGDRGAIRLAIKIRLAIATLHIRAISADTTDDHLTIGVDA